MNISIVGAGAIGCVTAAMLADQDREVTLIGRKEQVDAINSRGLTVASEGGEKTYTIPAETGLFGKPDMVLLAVKSNDVEEVCKDLYGKLGDAPLLTMQNGVRSDEIAGKILGRHGIVSSVVMYGATYLEPGRVDYNFPGGLLVGKAFDETEDRALDMIMDALKGAVDVTAVDDIHGAHYTKLILNLNNALAGIIGRGLDDIFRDPRMCVLGVAVMREAFGLMKKAGVPLADLPDLPLEKLESLLGAPEEVSADVYGKIMTGLSKMRLPGSILQSIKRGRETEIDYLNGEVLRIAVENGLDAPINLLVTELVTQVRVSGRYMDADSLLAWYGQIL